MLRQQLAELERRAASNVRMAEGRGKQAKGRDPWAIRFQEEWERVFRELRNTFFRACLPRLKRHR